MDAGIAMKILNVALFAFGAEHLVRMAGKGEFIPFIRITTLAIAIFLAYGEVKKIYDVVKAFSVM